MTSCPSFPGAFLPGFAFKISRPGKPTSPRQTLKRAQTSSFPVLLPRAHPEGLPFSKGPSPTLQLPSPLREQAPAPSLGPPTQGASSAPCRCHCVLFPFWGPRLPTGGQRTSGGEIRVHPRIPTCICIKLPGQSAASQGFASAGKFVFVCNFILICGKIHKA